MTTPALHRHRRHPQAAPAPGARAPRTPRGLVRRWWPAAAETALALGVALLFTAWAVTIDDDPVDRAGQISGLAALQYRLALCSLPVLGATAWALLRAGEPVRRTTVRLAAAAAAGLVGGFLGGGLLFTLHGTPWALAGQIGDNGRLIEWTQEVLRTGSFDNIYPPGIPHIAAFIARHFEHDHAAMAFKPLFVGMLALTPGLVYAAWRMVLGPLPALAVAVFGSISEYMPYKPYDLLTLMVLIPVIAKLAQWLRTSPGFSAWGAALRGVWLGVMLGTIFVVYSGWHVWSFPGTLALVLVLFPWRRAGRAGRLRGLLLLAGTLAGFLPIAGAYLKEMLGATGVKDTWCSQITMTDPAYIGQLALSKHQWELPGSWPPPGETAGLGFFALALLAGLGVAVALGLRETPVAAAVACFGGSWLMRFYLAHNMAKNGEVQLFPHTTMEIQYTLIVLAVLACVLVAGRVRALAGQFERRPGGPTGLGPVPFGAVGALLALILVGGMGGSFLTDRFMAAPPAEHTAGYLAWTAHQLSKPDGSCPAYADKGVCTTPAPLRPEPSDAPAAPLKCSDLYAGYADPAARK